MINQVENRLKSFRENLYQFFSQRRDVSMELVDSLSSNIFAKSIVELSLNSVYRRNYCSITRAIGEFYTTHEAKQTTNQEITKLLAKYSPVAERRNYHLFGLDCTFHKRLFSPTLADRSFVYSPHPVAGNKPVTIGHQYSVVAYLPEKTSKGIPPWVLPLSCERVSTDRKSTDVGIQQIHHCISQSSFQDKLCVSVGDCTYSHSDFISEMAKNLNQIHISRSRNNRTFYFSVVKKSLRQTRGRPKVYGNKFLLKARRLKQADAFVEFKEINRKGKEQIIRIESWDNMLMRGKKKPSISQCHLRLVRVKICKPSGKLLFYRPLWIIVSGEKRKQLSLPDIFNSYRQRFDIEHFFRFGKEKLLMDKIQTPEVTHEEAWWQFVIMAYAQLYLSRELADNILNPWEKYLPETKNYYPIKSPTQTQKCFGRIIREIGTPAKPPKQRKESHGRRRGDIQIKRKRLQVVLKRKKTKAPFKMVT